VEKQGNLKEKPLGRKGQVGKVEQKLLLGKDRVYPSANGTHDLWGSIGGNACLVWTKRVEGEKKQAHPTQRTAARNGGGRGEVECWGTEKEMTNYLFIQKKAKKQGQKEGGGSVTTGFWCEIKNTATKSRKGSRGC